MSFLRKWLGKRNSESDSKAASPPPPPSDPSKDPDMILVYDGFGRERYISKKDWRDSILVANLEKVRDKPDELYTMLVGALQDGFAEDIVTYAEHLCRTDPIPSRGATILGVVYMENNRLDDAERIFKDYMSAHGEHGLILTNLAKVLSRRGDDPQAETVLWHALEVDPNQDNGLEWYAAIHRERAGDAGAMDAFRRVGAMPHSWRAQLWLAREALQRQDLDAAKNLYEQSLARMPTPPPADVLMQISGDLGQNGYLSEIIQLVEPRFDPEVHGLQVGNNLIKANHDLGRIDAARCLLDQLYAIKRHDWQQTLRFWDAELANTEVASRNQESQQPPSVTLMSVQGPLWTRDGSPFSALVPAKPNPAPQIAVFGSTVLANTSAPGLQLSDRPGRLSRVIPLFLVEWIHLHSDAIAVALIPWAQRMGFALFGTEFDADELCKLAGKGDDAPDILLAVTVDARQETYTARVRMLRIAERACLAEEKVELPPDNPGPTIRQLAATIQQQLAKYVDLRVMPGPPWYQVPSEFDSSDYLLRLEQQLAVMATNLDFLEGASVSGEREILDGALQLCVRQPSNPLVRILFAQTLRQLHKSRPAIVAEFREKIDLLQHDHPLTGDVGNLIDTTIRQVLEGSDWFSGRGSV